MSTARLFVGSLILWGAIGIAQGSLLYQAMAEEGAEHSAFRLVLWQALIWGAWAPLTPLVWRLAERWPIRRPPRWRTVGMNLAGGAAVVLAHVAFTTLVTRAVPPMEWASGESFASGVLANLRNRSILDAVVFVAILALASWIGEAGRSRERALVSARLETELARAELRALQLQIHPHFLFNALHTVAGLVRDGRDREAVDAIASLSDLLRHVLDNEQRLEVRLHEELELLRRYAEVQQARFGDRLRIRIESPPELDTALVPNLILLPLVENAVSHGIGKLREGGRVEIRAEAADGRLRLSVFNEGPPAALDAVGRNGIGLANTAARLEARYGDSAALEVSNREGGVAVAIDLPLRREAA